MTKAGGPAGLVAETPRPRAGAAWWTLASIGLLVGGLIHFVLVPDHLGQSLAAGLFFLVLASLQAACAFALGRHRSTLLLHAAMALAGISLVVYAVTRVVAAPYAEEAEGVDGYGVVAKAFELLAVVAVARVLAAQDPAGWEGPFSTPARRVALSLAVATLLAAALLGLGYLAEGFAPSLGESGGHTHGHAALGALSGVGP